MMELEAFLVLMGSYPIVSLLLKLDLEAMVISMVQQSEEPLWRSYVLPATLVLVIKIRFLTCFFLVTLFASIPGITPNSSPLLHIDKSAIWGNTLMALTSKGEIFLLNTTGSYVPYELPSHISLSIGARKAALRIRSLVTMVSGGSNGNFGGKALFSVQAGKNHLLWIFSSQQSVIEVPVGIVFSQMVVVGTQNLYFYGPQGWNLFERITFFRSWCAD
jgi:hypothetical protein